MRVSKKEAAQRLGISMRTLDARCKAGLIQFEKEVDTICNGFKGNARKWIILPDPPAPAPAPAPVARAATAQSSTAPLAESANRDQTFAERYLAGEATDSLGNRHDGVARKSLLGPTDTDRPPEAKPDPTSHMDSRLIGEAGSTRVENPIDSDAYMELIHPGHMERKAAMYAACGLRPLSQQQEKERIDRLRINAAFRWAR